MSRDMVGILPGQKQHEQWFLLRTHLEIAAECHSMKLLTNFLHLCDIFQQYNVGLTEVEATSSYSIV